MRNKLTLIGLLLVQLILVYLIVVHYKTNDDKVAQNFIQRNMDVCIEKLGAHGEDVSMYSKNASPKELVNCLDRLKEYENFILIEKFE